jgi:hypothetical protein
MAKKEIKNFKSLEALQSVVNVVNEASEAVKDKSRTIANSAIPDVLAGALGAGIGGVISFAALYGLGTVGLSAVGITSGLAAAGVAQLLLVDLEWSQAFLCLPLRLLY